MGEFMHAIYNENREKIFKLEKREKIVLYKSLMKIFGCEASKHKLRGKVNV